ncbi:MAG: hypothetical protein MI700_04625, partial [Balneolales bacterium]|nr:hypothetical protein [Balneolales bacterium]
MVSNAKHSGALFLFWNLFLVVSLSLNVLAQPTDVGGVQSLELRISTLEQQYDSQIIQVLSNYFDRRKFFVDVNINAELVDEPYGTTQNQVVQRSTENIMMPGLPFLPDDNLRPISNLSNSPGTVLNENTIKMLRLISMNINIYADTSITSDQLELLRFITGIAVKVDESRGDQITISQIVIPDYTEKPEPVTQATINPAPTLYDSIVQYIPGVILMFLFGLTILFSRFMSKPHEVIPAREYRESFKNDFTQYGEGYQPGPITPSMITPEEDKEEIHNELTGNKEEVVDAFFNKPEEIAEIFRYWLSEEENGSQRAAEILIATDKQLLRTLRSALHPEDFETLSDAILDYPEITREKKKEVLTEFTEILSRGAKESISEKKRSKFSLFKFLDHISDHHITRLLETEDSLSGAFILQYLPEESAAEFLEELDKEVAAKIMLHMASLSKLSYEDQERISNELFDKAMDLVEAERSEQYGAEHIYPILERLPVQEQQKYINELKATGSIVGAILEKQFITIDRIPDLDDELIRKAVKSFNTQTLLDAILGLHPAIVDKILMVRPQREQRLLRLELEELAEAPP